MRVRRRKRGFHARADIFMLALVIFAFDDMLR